MSADSKQTLDDQPTRESDALPRSVMPVLQWIGVSLVGATALTLLAAHAPPRIRLLGLFAVGFGALCVWGMARAAEWLGVSLTPLRGAAIAGVVVAAAEVGLTLESWRLDVERQRNQAEVHIRKVPAMLREFTREELEPILERETRFDSYLARRVKNLGEWSPPWPLVFWIGEVILGTATGVGVILLNTPTVQREANAN